MKGLAASRGNGSAAGARKSDARARPQRVVEVDSSYLEGLVGYNARRAALSIIALFLERMEVYALRPVDFSVLSLIRHNPGITSRQLCATLGILPPNLVAMVGTLERRALIERSPHHSDGRALSLHLTPAGQRLMGDAERTAAQLERDATARLSAAEHKTLMRLLQKIYLQDAPAPTRAPAAFGSAIKAGAEGRRTP